MELIRLLINGISYSQTQNGAYALILSDPGLNIFEASRLPS